MAYLNINSQAIGRWHYLLNCYIMIAIYGSHFKKWVERGETHFLVHIGLTNLNYQLLQICNHPQGVLCGQVLPGHTCYSTETCRSLGLIFSCSQGFWLMLRLLLTLGQLYHNSRLFHLCNHARGACVYRLCLDTLAKEKKKGLNSLILRVATCMSRTQKSKLGFGYC